MTPASTPPRRTLVRALTGAATFAAAAAAALADPVLELHGGSLTDYRPATSTRVGDIQPARTQRGVNVDGTLWAPSVQGWALQGNPFEGAQAGRRMGPVDLFVGTYSVTEVDLALPQPDLARWVIGRSYNCMQEDSSGTLRTSTASPQGVNWMQMSQPEIVFYDGATDADDMVYIVYGADRFLEFKRTGPSSSEFKGKNGAAGLVQHVAGTPDTYVYYDQHGTRTYFFGDDTAGDAADWQIWKIVDPAGNTVYVGHETDAATAVSKGYNADGTIAVAYDAATPQRRYCYSYSSGAIGAAKRLTQVLVEIDAGGGWGDCGTETMVAKVEYGYYESDTEGQGKAGDLRLVAVTTPMTNSARSVQRFRAYRYYDQAWADEEGRRGSPHQLKLSLGYEGARGFDWDSETPGVLDFSDDFAAATDDALKPYAEVYLEYAPGTDRRISEFWTDGQCGCGGGINGTYELTYSTSSGHSTNVANTTYDTGWDSRTSARRPDGTYDTFYFDEVGQALSHVLTDGVPGSHTDEWVTEVIRDSDGRVSEIRSPAANASYTHSTGAMTINASDGLVTVLARKTSGDMAGFVEHRKHARGSGTAYPDSSTEYTSATLTVGSVVLTRPLISATRLYSSTTEGGGSEVYDQTTYSYDAFWDDQTASTLMPKQITVTHPAVSTGNNGSGSAAASVMFQRRDGTVAFHAAPDGVYTYTAFTNGQMSRVIRDAQLDNSTGDFVAGDDPAGTWGIAEVQTPATRFRDRTELTYDHQGRLSVQTQHAQAAASEQANHEYLYESLADNRIAELSAFFTPGTPRLYEVFDVPYRVYNGNGELDDCMILVWSGPVTTTPMSGWGDVVEMGLMSADPLERFDHRGTIERLTRTKRSGSGARIEQTRVYFKIPTSGEGTEGTNYDATTYAYDDFGRVVTKTDPTGTITRYVYDEAGRRIQTRIGTIDGGASDNMVTVEEVVYDNGLSGGNGWVTKTTAFVQNGTTGRRDTTYERDYRGRVIVTRNPQPPHILAKYDNRGRTIALGLYSSDSGLDAADDPLTLATNRMALSETYFDERGRAWKTVRHNIDPADGSDDDTLVSQSWFDSVGRLIKTDGSELAKFEYDTLGRQVRSYVLGTTDDNPATYTDADDVTGDVVLEESQSYYHPGSGDLLMSATIQRFHDDLSTTGPLDTDSDLALLDFTNGRIKGRLAATAYWYDNRHRVTATAFYGTNGAADLDRDALGSAPTASDPGRLVTIYTYGEAGVQTELKDPKGVVTRTSTTRPAGW